MTCVKLLMTVALGAYQAKLTTGVSAAVPYCAKEAVSAARKLLLGEERISPTSKLRSR
jgi:hypothetical protein